MRHLKTGIIILLALLGAAAGAAKVMQTPQELEFFATVGLGNTAVLVFGVLQFAAATLFAIPQTRFWGGTLLCVSFVSSAAMLLLAGAVPFGLVTLVPAGLSAWIAVDSKPAQATDAA